MLEHLLADHGGDTALITFGVPVPPNTPPAAFCEFLQQQGYLRMLIDGKVHRVDEPQGIAQLTEVVFVIQDRLQLAPENHARICEAIETALVRGVAEAQRLRLCGLIEAAALSLNGVWRVAGGDALLSRAAA